MTVAEVAASLASSALAAMAAGSVIMLAARLPVRSADLAAMAFAGALGASLMLRL